MVRVTATRSKPTMPSCGDFELGAMNSRQKMWAWMVDEWQWPKASLFCGVILILTLAAMLPQIGVMYFLIAMTLPLYMVHQFEEHYQNRFCLMLNKLLGKGRVVLTPAATFIINSLLVWGLCLASIALGFFVNPLLGLSAVYLIVLNGILHCLQAIRFGFVNPGLITSIVLFLPFGGYTIFVLSKLPDNCWQYQVIGISMGVLGHVVILVKVGVEILNMKPRTT